MLEAFIAVLRHQVLTLAEMREKGATAVEYGMIVALIAAVIVTIVATLGTKILAAFTKISGAMP